MIDLLEYTDDLRRILAEVPLETIERVIEILQQARARGRTVFIMGNGGSASTASHFVCDLAKNTRRKHAPLMRVVGLTDNIALMTAYGNDEGYENIFSEQLANQVAKDDVVIAISTSGQSKNVLKAIEVAKAHQAVTVGFTGAQGGRLAGLVDINVFVPSNRIEYVEDIHLILEHMITARLKHSYEAEAVAVAAERRSTSDLVESDSTVEVSRPVQGQAQAMTRLPAPEVGASMSGVEALRRVLTLSLQGVNALSGSAILVDGSRGVTAGVLAHRGQLWEVDNPEVDETIEQGLAGWVMRNRQPALVDNTQEDPRWLKRTWETQASRSAISVPLVQSEQVLGVLTLVSPRKGSFTENDLAFVTALGTGLAILAAQSEVVVAPAGQSSGD